MRVGSRTLGKLQGMTSFVQWQFVSAHSHVQDHVWLRRSDLPSRPSAQQASSLQEWAQGREEALVSNFPAARCRRSRFSPRSLLV